MTAHGVGEIALGVSGRAAIVLRHDVDVLQPGMLRRGPTGALVVRAEDLTDPDAIQILIDRGDPGPGALEVLTARVGRIRAHLAAVGRIDELLEGPTGSTGVRTWDELLDDHQVLGARCLVQSGLLGACLFDEQGTGKTLTAAVTLDLLKRQGRIDSVLVVCPKSVIAGWLSVLELVFPGRTVTVDGSRQNRLTLVRDNNPSLVMNFEALVGVSATLASWASRHSTALVVDESYYAKNPDSVRAGHLTAVRRRCEFALVLCGTPAPNSPLDIISQVDIADDGITFAGFRDSGDDEEVRRDIQHRMERRGPVLRRMKSDVLPDLPGKQVLPVVVTMSATQRSMYQKAIDTLYLELRAMNNQRFRRELVSYFQKRAALLQICVDPRLIDPSLDEAPSKYLALDALVDRLRAENRKIVVWATYRHSIDELVRRYESYGTVRLDGAQSAPERALAVDSFQSDPSTTILIGNPAAGGAGVTLHAASDAVYVSLPDQAAQFLQSIDRIHRRGMPNREARYHFLICRDSVEQSQLAHLQRKMTSQHDLLRDDEEEFSLEAALKELSDAGAVSA